MGCCMLACSTAYANNIGRLKKRNVQQFSCDTLPVSEHMQAVGISGVSNRYDVFYIGIPETKVTGEKVIVAKKDDSRRVPLLKVTGNILYDVNYRSRIDTPYAENDVYQHTLQTRLDLLYKEQYPL